MTSPRRLILVSSLAALLPTLSASQEAFAQGWSATYYNARNFGTPLVSRTDAVVNIAASADLPPGVPTTNFTVRWLGMITPRYSETFEFTLTGDDGIRLWVNNEVLVDGWVDQGPTAWRGQMRLEEGVAYPVMVEMYQASSGFRATLEWSSASQVREVIPADRVSPGVTAGPLPEVRIFTTQSQTAERGPLPGRILLTRFSGLDQELPVQVAVGGDAVPGVDFVDPAVAFVFPAHASTLAYTVVAPDDALPEPDRTVTLDLLDGPGYLVQGSRRGAVLVRDNDRIQEIEGGFVVGAIRQNGWPQGAGTGQFVIQAYADVGRTQSLGKLVKLTTGIYSLGPLPSGTTHVSAFWDLNRNGRRDTSEVLLDYPLALDLPPDVLGIDFDFTPRCGEPGAPLDCPPPPVDEEPDAGGGDDVDPSDAGWAEDAGTDPEPADVGWQTDAGHQDADTQADADAAADAASDADLADMGTPGPGDAGASPDAAGGRDAFGEDAFGDAGTSQDAAPSDASAEAWDAASGEDVGRANPEDLRPDTGSDVSLGGSGAAGSAGDSDDGGCAQSPQSQPLGHVWWFAAVLAFAAQRRRARRR